MPANKNAMTRYKVLDELLSNPYRRLNLDDLTAEVNNRLAELEISSVTRRCIEKDLQYLEYDSPYMVEIKRESVPYQDPITGKSLTKRCLRYAEPGFSIFKKEMTDDEKYLLSEAISLLGQFEGLPNMEGLEGLRKSLNIKPRKQIISLAKNPLENSSLLGQIFTAISQEVTIDLHYHTFAEPKKIKNLLVSPYLLKEYNRRWFLIAAAQKDGKILNFALDRIDKIESKPEVSFKPCEDDLYERFEDIIGVTLYEDKPTEKILFWVSDKSKDYVASKPIHESQKHHKKDEKIRTQYPMLQGGAFFSIECKENYELIRELCSYGEDLVVLSPSSLQDAVKERIVGMQNVYKRLRK